MSDVDVESIRRQLEALKAENARVKSEKERLERLREENEQLKEENKQLKERSALNAGAYLLAQLRSDRGSGATYMLEAEDELVQELKMKIRIEFLKLETELIGGKKGTVIELHGKDIEKLKKFGRKLKLCRNLNWLFGASAFVTYLVRAFSNIGQGGYAFLLQAIFTGAEYLTLNEEERLYKEACSIIEEAYKKFEGVARVALELQKVLRNIKGMDVSLLKIMSNELQKYCENCNCPDLNIDADERRKMLEFCVKAVYLVYTVYCGLGLLPFAFTKSLTSVPLLHCLGDGLCSIGFIALALSDLKTEELSNIEKGIVELEKQLSLMKDLAGLGNSEK